MQNDKIQHCHIKSDNELMGQIYKSVYDNSVYGIAVYTRIGRIIAMNQKGRQILGYGPHDLVEVDVRNYFYGEDPSIIEHEIAETVLGEAGADGKRSFSHRCMRADGTVIWLKGERNSVFLEDGSTFILSTFVDATEQKLAEKMLLEKLEWNQNRRRMLLGLYDGIPIGILQQTISPTAVCVDINKASIRLLGYDESPKTFLARGMDFFSCVCRKDQKKMEEMAADLEIGGKSCSFEARIQLPDGGIRWIAGEAQRLINLDGKEILQFCFSDNTAKKSIEQALEKEQMRNKLIADNTSSVIIEYMVKTDTAYKFRNMRHKDGKVSSHHMTIRNMSKRLKSLGLICPEDYELFEHCLIHGSRETANVRMSNGPDQGFQWYRAQFSTFYERGTLTRVLCIMDNIQAIMDMQSEKEILTELCHLVVSSKYEMIDLINVEERSFHFYIAERERWQTMPQSGDYDSMLMRYVLPMAYDQRTVEILKRLTLDQVIKRLEREETVQEYIKLRELGGFRWKLVEFSFLKSDQCKLFHVLSDVHDEKMNQERLEEALMDANKANTAKNDFLANISHEIRTPMNAIIGMSELLLSTDVSGDMEDKLMGIHKAGNGLLDIINDILDFSKIEAGKTQLIENPYSLTDLICDLAKITLAQLSNKPVSLFIRKERKVPDWFLGDELKTRQILMNILGNAIKFTDKGHISLHLGGTELLGGKYQIEIEVEDSGRGIREEDMEKLFEAFGQVDERKNRGIAGTGLGLPISRELARLMGGDIEVQSEYGSGSTFRIRLIQSAVKKMDEREEAQEDGGQGKDKILVFEDDPLILRELRWALDDLGAEYEVCEELGQCKHMEEINFLIMRSNKLQETLAFSSDPFPEGEILVLMEQNESVTHITSGYRRISLPLFGIRMERILNGMDELSEKERFSRNTLHNVVMPGVKILVADDNEVNRIVTEEYLRPYMVEVALAEDGFEAIRLAKQEQYQMILMDQMMPGLDGIQTVREIRKLDGYGQVPVVALTADATAEAKLRFQQEGYAGYLIKPVRMAQLEEILIKQLGAHCRPSDQDRPEDEGTPKEFYQIQMNAYKKDIETIYRRLPECYRHRDQENFTILAHRLKGASSEVGAGRLEEQAARMEQLGREGRWDEIARGYDGFIKSIGKMIQKVNDKLKKYLNDEVNYVDIKRRDSLDHDHVIRLKQACADMDFDTAEKVLQEMRQYLYDESTADLLKTMSDLCDRLQYDELESVVGGLIEY